MYFSGGGCIKDIKQFKMKDVLKLEIVFTIAAPAFDILFIGCVYSHKDYVYNCWEINIWSLLLTFKCCKMLLDDGKLKGNETNTNS